MNELIIFIVCGIGCFIIGYLIGRLVKLYERNIEEGKRNQKIKNRILRLEAIITYCNKKLLRDYDNDFYIKLRENSEKKINILKEEMRKPLKE